MAFRLDAPTTAAGGLLLDSPTAFPPTGFQVVSVDALNHLGTATVTVSGGTAPYTVSIGGVSQTVTNTTGDVITFTVDVGSNRLNVDLTLTVTDDTTATAEQTVQIGPRAGGKEVILGSDYRPQWVTGEAITEGDERWSLTARVLYVADNSGNTGATEPTHTDGTESDGAVSWTVLIQPWQAVAAVGQAEPTFQTDYYVESNPSLIEFLNVLPDGRIETLEGWPVEQTTFEARFHDGTGWGQPAVQTVELEEVIDDVFASVAETNPMQTESVAAEQSVQAVGASVAETNPFQSESVGVFQGIQQVEAVIAEANPLQTESVNVGQVGNVTAAVAETNPLQTESVGVTQGIQEVEAVVAETNPFQTEAVALGQVENVTVAVAETNPFQTDESTAEHEVPQQVTIAASAANPLQIEAMTVRTLRSRWTPVEIPRKAWVPEEVI